MIKLRTILLSNYPFIIILILSILFTIYKININYKTTINSNENTFLGYITDINIDGAKLILKIKTKENIICKYYFKTSKEKNTFNLKLGDKIQVFGILSKVKSNTIPNTFNNKEYLYHNKIYYQLEITKYQKIKSATNIFYILKNNIITRITKYKSFNYLNTFILGNHKYISNKVYKTYQSNGVCHLFAISGMHISLLSSLLLKRLKYFKVKELKRYLIVIIFLLIYMFLTNYSPSVMRSVIFFILLSINKIYYFFIKPINLLILTLSIMLIINPFFIYNIGFLYSFSISLSLILYSNYLKSNNYILNLLKVSILSFLISMPITIYNFYEINFLSIINNLIFVPLISYIIFPLSLITLIFKPLDNLLIILIKILEFISINLNNITIFKFIIYKPSILVLALYYVLIFIFIYGYIKNNYKLYIPLFVLLISNYIYHDYTDYIIMFDIGQGDSILIHSNNKNILIDTGGKVEYIYENFQKKINDYNVSDNTILFMKSFGIKKLDYLILTHGDADHLGDAINIVNNFKVDNVIFNIGRYNYLEKNLIKLLNKNKIKYYKGFKQLNINNNKLYFLNTFIYKNENDNSNVIYLKYHNYKFLFMGDAGIKKEKDILEKYNIREIDFLKLGHHGSDTSSSKDFINELKPKNCLISVGENNKYGHPKQSVLDIISNCRIYRTDKNGSIKIILYKNNYEINRKIKNYSINKSDLNTYYNVGKVLS